jgi:AP-5 complex subunit beta-1
VASDSSLEASTSITGLDQPSLHLTYFASEDERENLVSTYKINMGCFLILIFLPPRFHLLFQKEVCDVSTLVRISNQPLAMLSFDIISSLFQLSVF